MTRPSPAEVGPARQAPSGVGVAPHSVAALDDAALAARLVRAVIRHPPSVGPAAGHRCPGGTHSRTADGRVVCWSVPPADGERVAVDAECVGAASPPALARRWSIGDGFEAAWTATEVVAKLTDIPVLLLARHGPVLTSALTASGRRIVLHHTDQAGLHLCFGLSVARVAGTALTVGESRRRGAGVYPPSAVRA
ncbi:MAG: hypothetical protein ACRCYX_05330 [Dermatophilaceae bacterium]